MNKQHAPRSFIVCMETASQLIIFETTNFNPVMNIDTHTRNLTIVVLDKGIDIKNLWLTSIV